MNTNPESDMHPAVVCHYQMVQAFDDFLEGEGSREESLNVPNHNDLIKYLDQLPSNVTYRILDPEASSTMTPEDEILVQQLRDGAGLGLITHFGNAGYDDLIERKPGEEGSNSFDAYGGCQMLEMPDGQGLGMRIYVNGCEAQSAPEYYVVPTN